MAVLVDDEPPGRGKGAGASEAATCDDGRQTSQKSRLREPPARQHSAVSVEPRMAR